MSKLKAKFENATAVTLTMRGGKRKMLAETERHACIHALSGHLQSWEKRCAALYQVIGSLAHSAGCFDHPDVIAALDVAVGRGDVEKLLPWPKDEDFDARLAGAPNCAPLPHDAANGEERK